MLAERPSPATIRTMVRVALAVSSLLAAGCGDGEAGAPLTIEVRGRVGAEAFECGRTYEGLGRSGSELELRDFRLYVHDVRLIRAGDGREVPLRLDDDGQWQRDGVALLDFEDGSGPCAGGGNPNLNARLVGSAPAGAYAGLRFRFGVPFDLNHDNAATAAPPLSLSSMFWSWNGGYKFIRLDGSTPALPSWRVHIGSTGCEGDSMGNVSACLHDNRSDIELSGFDPSSDALVVDLAGLLEGADLDSNVADTPEGCMSTPEDTDCEPIFHNLGLPYGGAPSPGQRTFRAEAR